MANNYNDALERAKQAIIDCGSNASRKEMIYSIFPELREWGEAEAARIADEKIRVELTDYFRTSHCDTIRGIPMYKVLTWFEKQKGHKPVEWNEKDKEMIEKIIDALPTLAAADFHEIEGWLHSLPEKFK